MATEKSSRPRRADALEPQEVRLPARPTFPKRPKLPEEEHEQQPATKGRFRPIKDVGKPTNVEDAAGDSNKQER